MTFIVDYAQPKVAAVASQVMIQIALSSSSVFPLKLADAFSIASELGYDGMEIMVTKDPSTQSYDVLAELVQRYQIPVTSIHAPVLLMTQHVWGWGPWGKVEMSAALARGLGASTVVVHPPYRWQPFYAARFLQGIREISDRYEVTLSVENMFPLNVMGMHIDPFAPSWNPTGLDCEAVTLDFSHASLAALDTLQTAHSLGDRLQHVHLCDGTTSVFEGPMVDQHLIPGEGTQPVAEVLRMLSAEQWSGEIAAEVSTKHATSDDHRREILARTLFFARKCLERPAEREPRPVVRRPDSINI